MLATGDAQTKRQGDWSPTKPLAEAGAVRPPAAPWYGRCKRGLDSTLAVALLVLALPLVLVAAVLVKLTSRGPVFYSQTRLGKNSRPYSIYKIRTMVHDCERYSGPQWSRKGDPRVTPVGRLLRRTHLDELPQLWNVLCGEMSLVGPRPERPEFAVQLERAIPQYNARLQVLPGLTGLAQVQLPPDTDINSVRRKLRYDLYYVQHAGLGLDLRLLLSTGVYMLGLPFALSHLVLRVPGCAAVERTAAGAAAAAETAPQLQSA
jgi:lipopolysaccharide/colanic/teichoic acid biosynthesis glycosyltransferase